MDESPNERFVESGNECESKKLLLKKNFSWTNTHSISCANSLKTSRSNPHVLDAVTSNVRSFASSLASLQYNSNRNRFQTQANSFQLSIDDVRNNKSCRLTKAFSATTLTATTVHQTLATPTSIRMNIQPNSDFKFCSRVILRHCQVNKSINKYKIYIFLSFPNTSDSRLILGCKSIVTVREATKYDHKPRKVESHCTKLYKH